jgi:hypothetical protein
LISGSERSEESSAPMIIIEGAATYIGTPMMKASSHWTTAPKN